MELMAADEHSFIETVEDTILERPQEPPAEESVADETVAERTITMPTERAKRRYPSRIIRTSYYNMNFKTALNRHGKKALRSIYVELMQMPEKQVFTPEEFRRLTKAQLREVISSSMFLKEKFLSNGDFEKLKARLVGGGHQQDKSKYEDISSPTVATSAVFIIASLAARQARNAVCVDIAGAYLNAEMSEQEVMMRLDRTMSAILVKIKPEYKSFLCDDGSMIVRQERKVLSCGTTSFAVHFWIWDTRAMLWTSVCSTKESV